ncbi:Aim44 protein [Maudiozyma humilis]|uniref:Aim44 protein n=1 Tax=Maudiozyma humilis TaxID=51915 RepID=A0AAV5RZT7_MAUHU|nr:Aim44 protein [Kazachstania humilis]
MIIRTPTRTKTKSFNGSQVDFKFPSTESLPRGNATEQDMNNHHLLNATIKTGEIAESEQGDNVSQILSDYTSASNTNSNAYTSSSNGYYSFANISDNTTSPRFFAQNKDASVSNLNLGSPGRVGNYPSTLAPQKVGSAVSSPALTSSSSGRNSLRGSIASGRKSTSPSQMASIPENKSMSIQENKSVSARTAASIPTADNISYEIISATSNLDDTQPRMVSAATSSTCSTAQSALPKNHATVVKHPMAMRPDNLSLSQRRSSIASRRRHSSSHAQPLSRVASLASRGSRKSQLKRSNAIRCKGGLLAYFSTIGMRIRKSMHKLRIVLRKRLFSSHGKNVGSRSSSSQMARKGGNSTTTTSRKPGKKLKRKAPKNKHAAEYSQSTSKALTTSHLKRTDGFVANVRRTDEPSTESSKSPTPITKLTPTTSQKDTPASHPPTLRRTNSSIRRAASILQSTPNTNRYSTASQSEPSMAFTSAETRDTRRSPGHMTRSGGMASLNSVIREPSIVVKNKVIPLTMHQYPIKEEDEYVIDTNSMQKLSSSENESDGSSGFSYFDEVHRDHHDKSSIYTTESTDDEDDENEDTQYEPVHKKGMNPADMSASELSALFNDYFSTIIAKRIRMRLQIGQYQESNNLKHLDSEYRDMLESLRAEYDSESSDIFDNDNRSSSESTSSSSSSESDSNSEFSFTGASNEEEDALDVITPLECKRDIKEQLQNMLSGYSHSQAASVTSLPAAAVKRSSTLPIGVTI